MTAALAVADKPATRAVMENNALTLAQAAVLAEFDGDEQATARLLGALERGYGFDHTAEDLRQARDEQRRRVKAAARLRGEGIPASDEPPPDDLYRLRLDDLVDAEGQSVDDPTTVPGAVVALVDVHPDDTDDHEPVPDLMAQVWIHPDPESVGLRHRWDYRRSQAAAPAAAAADDPDAAARENAARAEASEQRRQVIANNRAWRTAEPVRRAWLSSFVRRSTAPAGADRLICQAITTAPHSLQRAMTDGHPHLRSLLGQDKATRWDQRPDLADVPARSATMRTLAAVVAAWDGSADVHTWRNPTEWDAAVMTALIGWGYDAADVERLLLPADDQPPAEPEPDASAEPDDDTATA